MTTSWNSVMSEVEKWEDETGDQQQSQILVSSWAGVWKDLGCKWSGYGADLGQHGICKKKCNKAPEVAEASVV